MTTMNAFTLPASQSTSPYRRNIEAAGRAFAQIKEAEGKLARINEQIGHAEAQLKELDAKIEKADRALHRKQVEAHEVEEWIKDALSKSDSVRPVPTRLGYMTVDEIVEVTCRKFRVTAVDLRSRRQGRHIAVARQWCAQQLRDYTELSFPDIGHTLGGRHHTTIIHACSEQARKSVAEYIAAIEFSARGPR